MEVRDASALLTAIRYAQEPARDLFSGKEPLTLSEQERGAVELARQAVGLKKDVDYRTGKILVGTYKRAY